MYQESTIERENVPKFDKILMHKFAKGWLASAKLKKITRTAWIWVQPYSQWCRIVESAWEPNFCAWESA